MQSLNISSSALRGIQLGLDNTANNLANVETVGYKRRAASFSELLADSFNKQPDTDTQNRTTPAGLRLGNGAALNMTKLDMSPGNMKQTDEPTDLMIEGEGFFLVSRVITDATGAQVGEEFRFTRDGAFHLQESEYHGAFVLVNSSGYVLTNEIGAPILIPEDEVNELTISNDGFVTANGNDTFERVGIWKVDNPDQLQQVGNNLYDPALGAQNPADVYAAWEDGMATAIRQGALETSNVNMQEEISQLINIQRAYQLNSRAIMIADQMMGIATSIRS
ncbi:flagellar hook-basal body protein [Brevibacillus sp. TJ4]|uniref:flagellar hook-basal body protein n=1 Tax=Brevibacillus sp. TJ4 TaxID=3234853 RepID=UPI0037D56238